MFQNGVVEGERFKELVPHAVTECVTAAGAAATKHILKKKHFEKRKEELKYKLARACNSDSFLSTDGRRPTGKSFLYFTSFGIFMS